MQNNRISGRTNRVKRAPVYLRFCRQSLECVWAAKWNWYSSYCASSACTHATYVSAIWKLIGTAKNPFNQLAWTNEMNCLIGSVLFQRKTSPSGDESINNIVIVQVSEQKCIKRIPEKKIINFTSLRQLNKQSISYSSYVRRIVLRCEALLFTEHQNFVNISIWHIYNNK